VRQLTATAGGGRLGSAGSPGQLETSLNSGYTVGPCNSYLEGPTLVFGLAARASRWKSDVVVTLRERKACSLIAPPIVGRAICRRSQPRSNRPPAYRRRHSVLAALPRLFERSGTLLVRH
jgi:hypothetical protein